MGPDTTMNNLSMNSNSNSMTLTVPKLCDDGSNWSDYLPRLQNAMAMKGLWRHVEGTATTPVPYAVSNSVLDIGASYASLSFVCCIITYIPYAIT